MTLDQLSAAASQGGWEVETDPHGQPFPGIVYHGSPFEFADFSLGESSNENQANAALCVALVNAYRTGQLVAVSDDAIERVARTLAPNLEGGREFDQMPKDRAQLRQWTAQGMCLINDATQDDATWLAQEAIKAAKGTGDE